MSVHTAHTAFTSNKLGEQMPLSTVSLSEATATFNTAATNTREEKQAAAAVLASEDEQAEWTLQEWIPMEQDSMEYQPQMSHQKQSHQQSKGNPSVRRRMSARARGGDAALTSNTFSARNNIKTASDANSPSLAMASAEVLSLANNRGSSSSIISPPTTATAMAAKSQHHSPSIRHSTHHVNN